MRWTPPKGRVLVLAPHFDDETIGCGGAILLHRLQGDEVKIIFATDGAAGDPRRYYSVRSYTDVREAEARRAAAVLGVSSLEFWGYPDGALTRAPGVSRKLRDLLEREKPAVVYRPSSDDPHPDHKALALRFQETAARASGGFVDCRYEVGFLQKATAILDISGVFSRKARALRQYRSQLRYVNYLALASRAGICRSLFLPGASFAEAFRVTA